MSHHRSPVSRRRGLLTGLAAATLLVPMVAGTAIAGPAPAPEPQAGEFDGYRPVEWYESNRVHAHTRLVVRSLWSDGEGTEAFENAGALLADLGAQVYTRHVHTTDEDPWWPSAAPLGPDGERLFDDDRLNEMTCTNCDDGVDEVPVPAGTDLPAEFVAEAEASGTNLIAYYYHYHNRRVANEHPEWVCTGWDGEPNEGPRGPILDWTLGYREVVKTHLVELAETGVQAFYHDWQQDPPGGCRTAEADAAFTAATGLEPPTRRDNTDPVYHAWMEFRTEQRIDAFREWRAAVRAVQPEAVMIVSVTNFPALTLLESSSSRWADAVDAFKTEYHHAIRPGGQGSVFDNNPDLARPDADIQLSLGWVLMRDLAELSPHVWGHAFQNTEHVHGFIGSLAAHGSIANLNVPDALLDGQLDTGTPVDALESGFALGNQISPYLTDMQAERWAGVHFSESQRDARMLAAPTARAALVDAWTEVLWPVTGAYGGLARAGVPTTVLTDHDLTAEGLAGLRLLALPHREELTPDQAAAVDAWEAGGGVVIENDPAWQWADPEKTDDAAAGFASAVAPYLPEAQVRVDGGPEAMYATAFTSTGQGGSTNPLTIAITNDFSWVELRAPDEEPPNPAAPPATGVEVEFDADVIGCASPSSCTNLHIFDAVTDQSLEYETTETGYRVEVPSFDQLAVIAIDRTTACDETITGQHTGALTISSGVTCMDEVTHRGPVTVAAGASLLITDSSLQGSVNAIDAARVEIDATSLRGPLTVTGATESVRIENSELRGPVSITDGHTVRTVIAGNEIRGPIACHDNSPIPTADHRLNEISGRAQAQCADL